ncbi:MAG: mechanosensitive ion channel [Clostridia bacterium]|nr:mechanosensitive ion channel [Clostridia bacterium]
MNWDEIWLTITDFFQDNVWNIIGFFAALVIGLIVIKILTVVLKKAFTRLKMDSVAQGFLLTIIRFALWLVFIIILLSVAGVQVTGVITAVSAAILAIGMALQSNISNIANGIVIVTHKMFKKGDRIEVAGISGRISEINLLFTTINTADNKKVTVPNSTIVNSAVINADAIGKRRVDFNFPVAYESDVKVVCDIVLDVMKSDGRVYLDPAPFCKLKEFGDSSINFFANCWCDAEDYWDVYYYVMEHVFNEFKRRGVSIPYQQVEVRDRTDVVTMPYDEAPIPERVEKDRPEPETRIEEIKRHYNETKERFAHKKSHVEPELPKEPSVPSDDE